MKILSIDDSKSVHAFFDYCLTGTSYSIDHAYSGPEGLEMICSYPGKFDLILLDWEMPMMNGPEVLKAIKKLEIEIPVVMVTTKSDPKEISELLAAGALDYIMKPFNREILITKLENIL